MVVGRGSIGSSSRGVEQGRRGVSPCETFASLGKLIIAVMAGFAVSEVISSGSFYALSGTFAEVTWGEFGAQLLKYSPHGLYIMSLYLSAAALLHIAVRQIKQVNTTV